MARNHDRDVSERPGREKVLSRTVSLDITVVIRSKPAFDVHCENRQ